MRSAAPSRARLIEFLRTALRNPVLELTDDESIIRSGLLDSSALFELVFWIEKHTGAPVDPAAIDVAGEWDTVGSILAFIDRQRRRA